MDKVTIFGVEIFNISFEEAKEYLKILLKKDFAQKIFTPNTEIVMECKKNDKLKDLINSADLVVPDGIGLIYGSKIRKKPLKERVTGFDLSMELLEIAQEQELSIYLLGAKEGVAEEAAKNIEKKYNKLKIAGYHHGYFLKDPDAERQIIEEINNKKPDIVFVGLGFPKQEEWIFENSNNLNTKILIGNGGVIDILSGQAKRAPDIFIKLGLEWLYRLLKEPSRIGRQLAIPKFLYSIILDKDSVK